MPTSWPPDPSDYEAFGFDPASTARDVDRIVALAARHALGRAPRVVDIACGTGRHARELARRGHRVLGVDRDRAWVRHARATAGADGVSDRVCFVHADVGRLPLAPGSVDLAYCLFNTMLEIVDNDVATGLFRGLGQAVRSGGLFVIDNFCRELWAEVANGNYATGVSEDGATQMIWEDGENAFALRRGAEVDPERWEIGPTDRRYRLWSMRELDLLATSGGHFVRVETDPDLVYRRIGA